MSLLTLFASFNVSNGNITVLRKNYQSPEKLMKIKKTLKNYYLSELLLVISIYKLL